MGDYKQDGHNDGYGQPWRNSGHESPQTDGERYDYRIGFEDGDRRRRIANELDQ